MTVETLFVVWVLLCFSGIIYISAQIPKRSREEWWDDYDRSGS